MSAGHALQMLVDSADQPDLLAPQWRQIGISAVSVLRAPGVYGGRDIVIITTDFGVRRHGPGLSRVCRCRW